MAKLGSTPARWPAFLAPLAATFILCGAPLAALGCAAGSLAPVRAGAEGLSVARGDRVELTARVLRAAPDLPPELTPLQLTVKNLGDAPFSLELTDVELVSAEQVAVPVLPEKVALRPMGLGIDPASPFAMPHGGSSPAAAATARGSGGPVFEPALSDAVSGNADPRQRRILDDAFSGARIAGGEERSGVVYFETPRAGRVTLRVVVRTGEQRAPAEVLEIPFVVRG